MSDGGAGEDPLFTGFTVSNIGTPANPALPFYAEGRPDSRGCVANTSGPTFVDMRVGGFLGQGTHSANPHPEIALGRARDNMNRFQVPTLRNVDKRPDPNFVKASGHNGYFKSLQGIVHFYNTRDTLPRCQPNDPIEGVGCWPAPESTANMNTRFVGGLGLTDAGEDAIVAFLRTLSDGWKAEWPGRRAPVAGRIVPLKRKRPTRAGPLSCQIVAGQLLPPWFWFGGNNHVPEPELEM